jgi:hypothetical protein
MHTIYATCSWSNPATVGKPPKKYMKTTDTKFIFTSLFRFPSFRRKKWFYDSVVFQILRRDKLKFDCHYDNTVPSRTASVLKIWCCLQALYAYLSFDSRPSRGQEVICRFPGAAAQVRSQVGIFGFALLQVLLFPLPVRIQPTASHSLIILTSTLYSLDNNSVVK